jgi:hypothetical protein
MSEDTTAHGAIVIDPPIVWTTVACPAAWLAIDHDGGPWRDALLRVVETQEDTPDGVLIRRALDAIVPASLLGHDLLEQVQEIVDRFGAGRTFSGHLECIYAGGEDVWRIAIRDGRAVEIRPTWPDEQDRYEVATTAAGSTVWLTPHGDVLVDYPNRDHPDAGWQRLYSRIKPSK